VTGRTGVLKGIIPYFTAMWILLSPTICFGATIDVYPGEKIQDAVNSASAGDTIIVHTGTYTENIEVKKRLTIRNSGNVTVNAKIRWDPCIRITSFGGGSTIRGLTLGGATFDDGIYLDNANGCYIENNLIRNNGHSGINCAGTGNTISGNQISNNDRDGIHIRGDNNTVYDNTIDDIGENGIYIHGKGNKVFGSIQYSQSISDCGLAGIRLDTGISPFQSTDVNEVYNNLLEKNFHGIHVVLSSSNKIHDNKITDHHQGIYFRDSSSNDIYSNTVKWNKEFGINITNVLWLPSKSNLVHNNTISECIIHGISLTNIELFNQETLNQVYENDISACLTGINAFWEHADIIRDNTMTLVGVGIALEGSKNTTIFQNRIRVDVIGLWFINSSSDSVSFNSIWSLGHALINTGILSSPGHINARYNWWGFNDDPGSQIEGTNVVYAPYLVLSVDPNPEKSSIPNRSTHRPSRRIYGMTVRVIIMIPHTVTFRTEYRWPLTWKTCRPWEA
jgi:parallel beta-helix repeat protein